MTGTRLAIGIVDIYRAYIDCLNRQDWQELGGFLYRDVVHNGRQLGQAGYRAMLEQDYRDIPDLRFDIQLMLADANLVAARLGFDCHPEGEFLGLPVNGRRVVFTENVFYRFEGGEIQEVWSVLDKAALEAQL